GLLPPDAGVARPLPGLEPVQPARLRRPGHRPVAAHPRRAGPDLTAATPPTQAPGASAGTACPRAGAWGLCRFALAILGEFFAAWAFREAAAGRKSVLADCRQALYHTNVRTPPLPNSPAGAVPADTL